MIVTKKYIRDLRENNLIISEIAETLILEEFCKDPEPCENGCVYTYNEQDIWENARKIIRDNP
ncbi:MAG: hypothetical protein ACREVX_14555 [Clostridium sp.]|uniref:hypothetical protein n=1 Tax=Clostridium sp. TaxID=1506 RepID=UPI003D6CB662